MKKAVGRNQFVLTAMAILLAIVGYLNFTGDKENKESKSDNNITYNSTDNNEEERDVIQSVMAENMDADIDATNDDDVTDDSNVKNDNDTEETMNDENTDRGSTDIENADEDNEGNEGNDESADADKVMKNNVGEVVMVNNFISTDAIYNAKLQREQSRAKNKADLLNIVDDEKTSQDMKDKALNEILSITANAEKELAAESLLAAKGYDNAIVSIAGKGADVIVDVDSITSEDATVIMDVVKRKTGVEGSNIVISPVTSAGEVN